jgi:CRISPR/Cas system-associated protein Csx1
MSLMPVLGLFPMKLIENTQLQSGETRLVRYALPSSLEGEISKAVVTLRFYDIYDWLKQDISKAHWVSEPIVEKEINL